ncbi:hypothetical protein C8R47DRAFT_1083063 [Mycena vitilis]|nr:hypothetical protein C8R47DRAFT_1083063 [Mycena vitilis]
MPTLTTQIKVYTDGILTPLDQTYDATEPHLGIYEQVAVQMMDGQAYGEHWEFVFRRLDGLSLFKLGMSTPQLFGLVMEYVARHMPDSGHVDELRLGGPRDMLSKLPVELFPQIFASVKFADRLSVGGASRKFRALRARELQAAVRRLCARFGLSYAHVRFMQSATLAVIAGPALASVVDYDHVPGHLDFYVPDLAYPWVLRFFELAVGYTPFPDRAFHRRDGVQDKITFYHSAFNAFIQVMRSRTDSGLDCIPYSPFSHLFWAATHYGIWMGYPKSTGAGISLPNRDCTDFAGGGAYHHVCAVIREFAAKYRFRFSLQELHMAGRVDAAVWVRRDAESTARLDMDRNQGSKHFLVNTMYGSDFATTRDRTTAKGGLWTFKRCDAEEPEDETRGQLRVFFAHVFGKVDLVAKSCNGYIVRIGCPLDLLHAAIAGESCNSVQLKRNNSEPMFTTHHNVEMVVALTRTQSEVDDRPTHRYCIRSTEFWTLTSRDMPRKEAGYVCDTGLGSCPSPLLSHVIHLIVVRRTPFAFSSSPSMVTPYLALHNETGGSRSLSNARYAVDFLPTRDGSLEDGKTSKFTFKDLSLITGEVPATEETQGYLHEFHCIAFGEVLSVEILNKRQGVVFELGCPEDASCAAVEVYLRQLAALRAFIDLDMINADGMCASSWFTSPTSGAVRETSDKRFWILVKPLYAGNPQVVAQECAVGTTIDVLLTFQRNDRTNDATGVNELMFNSRGRYTAWWLGGPSRWIARRYRARAIIMFVIVPRADALSVPSCCTGGITSPSPWTIELFWLTLKFKKTLRRNINLRYRQMLLPDPPATRLTNVRFRQPKGLSSYEVDFQANRVRTTMDGKGSHFFYRHVAPPPRATFGDSESQTVLLNRIFTLVGCVVGIHGSMTRTEPSKLGAVYLTLGLPENATDDAVRWHAQQEEDLAHIARVDQAEADGLPQVIWGPGHSHVDTKTPTVIITVYKEQWRRLKKGDDVAVNCFLSRLDAPVAAYPDPSNCIDFAWLYDGRREEGRRRAGHGKMRSTGRPALSLPTMLSRMQDLGVLAVARAKYGRDFGPVRKCTVDGGGSLYLMKSVPGIMFSGTRERRGILANYTGHVFGEIDRVFILAGDTEAVVRLRLPSDASCALTRLFLDQEEVMREIMATDDLEMGGRIKESFFDLSASHPAIDVVPHSFYVSLERSDRLISMLRNPGKAVAKMSFSRYDEVDERTEETVRSYRIDMWSLDIREPDYFPTRVRNGYVCDINGAVGCSLQDLLPSRVGSTVVILHPRGIGRPRIAVYKKQALQRYMPLVFGAVKQTYICVRLWSSAWSSLFVDQKQDGGLRFCVLLQCPPGTSCEAKLFYYRQCLTLRNIVRDELSDSGSVKISWFDQATEGFCVPVKQSGFYVMVQADSLSTAAQFKEDFCTKEAVGQVVQFVVTLERRDLHPVDAPQKVYTMFAAEYQFQEDGCLPTVGDGSRTTMPITTVPLTTLQTVSRIHDGFTAGETCLAAFLFPTGETQPITVKVPVIDAAALKTTANVRYMAWMATDPAHPLTNLEFLDMEVTAPNGEEISFTIFCPDQDGPMGRRDLLHPVNQWLASVNGLGQWRGNILVMRREHMRTQLMSVREGDLGMASACAMG